MHPANVKPAPPHAQPPANQAAETHPQAHTDACFRQADPAALAAMLLASRGDTLATFAAYEAALPGAALAVPYREELNPPLWELGHVGWFQAHWLGRNPDRHKGLQADPAAPRLPAARPDADALYDSSHVPHATRWHLPLPSASATRAELAAVLRESLALLHQQAAATARSHPQAQDQALYFHRLCLAHEDMHHEAAVYMAQALGMALTDPRYQPQPLPAPGPALVLPAGAITLGTGATEAAGDSHATDVPAHQGGGFAFDNECGTQHHLLPPSQIDRQVLRWRDYLPFAEAGGYADARWWPGRAAAWRLAPGHQAPRYLKREGGLWLQWRHGQWQPLNLDHPACHLTAYEADAWCAWAGRRLPTEAEWERAARSEPTRFAWGAVWEWTASRFGPYDGFTAHPYRDYSAPWFGSRRVLRGASLATQPRMRHLAYRNFYTPERNDIFAGFRSCAG